MASLPPWATRSIQQVDEPFRSDPDFWTAMAASADTFLAVVAAALIAAAATVSGAGGWSLLAFVLAVPLLGRAATAGRASSRRTRPTFATRVDWRDAERQAVARSFGTALRRRRF